MVRAKLLKREKIMKILIIGESCTDIYHYGTCSRLCPDAPVPVFKSTKINKNGGMAKNVEANILKISNDIEIDILTNDTWTEIKKTRYVDEKTNHMFLRLDENDDGYGSLDIEKFNQVNFNNYDCVIVSDYNKGFLSNNILKFISEKHKYTFIDTKRKIDEWSKNFTFIKVNNIEYENSLSYLTSNNHNLIVTKGPFGCSHKGKVYPVDKVEVKDTSGAGDTFLAALSVEYVKTKEIDKAIEFANKCATIVVQKQGVVTV
jgi:D-beta-D-heptose 7-phosphate kinase/D-beta-D-heptose 1-phosphate adenosyltransferase